MSISFATSDIGETLIYTKNNQEFVTFLKQDVETDESNNDVHPNIAIFNYLVQLHKQEAQNKYLVSINTIYNPDVYPGDTIKYLWDNETKGGLVFNVNHRIIILPQNKVTAFTVISYTTYSIADLLDIIGYQKRPKILS
jgi:hypothetical protein